MSLREHEVAPPEASEELRNAAREAGWSDELLDRFLTLHFTEELIQRWISGPVGEAEKGISIWERLSFGSLRVRDATYVPKDFDALVDVFANSPEPIGDWEVTVERSPLPLAQFDLQENVRVRALEDRGLFIGVFSYATQQTYVAGQEITVQYVSAYRVRKEFRGGGYSQLLNWLGGSVGTPYPQGRWFHVRSQNYAAVDWMNAINPRMLQQSIAREGDVPGFEVFVLQYEPTTFSGDDSGIRRGVEGDLSACVELINRTHDGLDLFTPYTEKKLKIRLNENLWGRKPVWWTHVYGWQEFYVIEKDRRVVACAGIWDRGAQVRERWLFKETSDERVIDSTCLIDFGFAEGHEEEMARLIEYLIGETVKLGRRYFVAPLQFQAEVAALLDKHSPVPEKRGLQWSTWDSEISATGKPDPPITRPYTDLGYW